MNWQDSCELKRTCDEAVSNKLHDSGIFKVDLLSEEQDRRHNQHLEIELRSSHFLSNFNSSQIRQQGIAES